MLSKSADEKILSQWDQIKDAFASSITGMFPISGRKNTLELTNLIYDDSKAKDADIKSQQLAKEQEKTWGVPVFAEFVLKDKETGNVINRSKQKIAVLPKMTQRFTYIIGGGEYNSAYQQRIKSGIYSKINEKGEHLTEINLNGRNNAFVKEARLKIPFDLETKKFKLNYATNNIPLYSFLKCVGVSDDEMKKEWGEDVWKANHTSKWQDDIKKIYEKKWKGRGLKVEGDSFEHIQKAVTEALSKAAVLPETTKLTLGRPVEKLSGKEILDASTHLLKTARGERAPDDQASMVFKQLLGLDDFIAEKFNSPKTGQALKLKIRNNVDRKDKVSSIISSDFFNRPLSQVFYSNALSQRPDQTNPLDILASKSLVTSMGPGGITSEHQLRPSMKMVNQTHFGVVDPISTPEGVSTGISLHLPIGVRKIGKEAKVYVYDTHEKKYAYKNPAEIHGDWLGSPDYFNWKGGHPVAAKEKVMAMSPDNHDFMEVDPKKVRYIIPSSRNLFTEATNAIPFLQCNQGNRTMTGSRQPSQGVSLVNREAPLVQVKSNSKDSFEKVFGSNFSHAAPEEGKVTHFVKDELGNTEEIHITDKSGNTHKVQIYNHFPLNEKKTFIHSEPIVKIGDNVTKGQTIADSTYTRNGVMSTGINMHTGYVNYKSLTFEDSVVISESAAKKLSSTHMHRPTIETGPEDVISLNKFLAYASSAGKKIKKDKLDNLDKDGVIKPGTRVKPGDILVAAVGKNELPEDFAKLGARLKGAILPYRDKSLVWDSEHEGEVVKVIKKPGDTGYTVHVKTVEPMKVGDKLCYDEETEILTKTGWKSIKDVQLEDEICTLNPATHTIEYQNPTATHYYPVGGKMYKAENKQVNFLVTLDHGMYVRREKEKSFSIVKARDIVNKKVFYKKDGIWNGTSPEYFIFPPLKVKAGQSGNGYRILPEIRMPTKTFMLLLGAFLSEGNIRRQVNKGNFGIEICQIKTKSRDLFIEALKETGLKFCENKQKIVIYSKQLMTYFSQFGKCYEKYIPQEVFSWSKEDLTTLFNWLIWGDGSMNNGLPILYHTTSKRLADDFQRLCLYIGKAGNIRIGVEAGPQTILGRRHQCRTLYRVHILNKVLEPSVKPENTGIIENYDKPVYCITVDNHIIYTRRAGFPAWSSQSARHGDKNIVGAILPDEHMPRVGGPNGKPLEMLTSPTGTPSRINLGQALELAASKIANKTGTPYITSNFQPGVDYAEKIRKELKEHGLKDKEVIYDPLLKVELENPVLTGHKYVLKLKHQVEKKESVRGMDQSLARKYSINEDPSRGGGEGAQAIAQLDMYALLAHGARANLREMTSYKAERQHNSETMADTDFWNRVMLGLPLQPPKATFAYKKFEGMLQGMGLNLKKDGYDTVLTPLTDKGVLHLSAGEITNSKMLRGKDDLEIKGGLFDKKITGGATGKGWSHITLAEPFPNPLFVGTKAQPGPAVVLSGLKYEDFEKVVRGEHTITVGGKELTGGKAINELLKKVDVNKEFEKVKNELKNLSGTTLDKANKKAKFLRALKNLNMKPDEAYIMNHLPVIPPAFRPVVPMSDGSIASADINTLYAHIIQDNAALKDKTTLQYNPELQKKLNASVYDKLKAAIGIGSVPTYEGNKELKGLAKTIAGDNPKSGFFQNKIMKRRQDLSMRSTITPAADLQLDQVAIPKDSAMELYKPFVIRTLIQSGKDLIEATKEVKEQTPMAWKALEHTIKERPVLIKRDPVLHKYNMQAYYPVLKEGKSIGLHPLACGAFNADFDGNCIIGDVIISLKLWYNYSGEDNSALKKALEEKYQMKFTETTKIVAVDDNGVMVEMEIRNMPRIEESLSYDSNGASVYAVPPGIFVWSYNHETNQPTYEPVTHLTVEERCDVAKVNTRRFEVTASTNESLCVYDHDTEQLVDICPKDAIGRLSPVMKRIPITGSIDDYELGWLIGAFLSDGAAPGTTIMYTKASQPHRDRFFAALQKLQGGTVNRRTYEEVHGPLEEISGISVKDHYTNINKSTLDLLQSCYERNERGEVPSGVRSALYKKMPVIACQFAEDTLIGLLAGLIDGDGSISINNSKAKPQVIANFSTSSPYLRDGITFLCRLLGIRNSVSETHPKAGRVQKHVNYTISFSTVDLQKIAPRLRLVKEDSINALNLLMSQDLKDDGDLVPVPNRIMSLVSSSAGPLKDDPIFASLRTIKSARKAGYYFTRNLAKYVLSFIKAANSLNVDLWEKVVYAEDVVWDTIVSVENLGKTTVYDLAIPTTKVFVVNGGLVIYDTMAVYLPLTEEARKEAIERMLPSKNLFSTTNYGIMHAPDQEAVIGIHLASTWGAKKDKKYNSLQDIVNDKTLHRSDVVKYKLLGGGEKETTKGRAVLASFLPDEYPKDKLDTLLHDSSFSFKKGTIHNYLETAARLDRKKYPDVVDGWRNLGNETAYRAGFSYSIHDLKPNKELRESILKPYHEAAAKVKATSAPQEEKDQKVIEIYSKATKELEDKFTKYYREQDNNMHKMIDIKARGNFGQFRQMVIAPMLMADNKGVIPTPITKSFSEGLSVPEYWNTLYGARMGTLSRAQGTSRPGALAKELANINVSTTIASNDCNVSKGHVIPLIGSDGKEEIDITDRYLAKDIDHPNLKLKANTIVTSDIFAKMKQVGIQKVEVRSPLTCKDPVGICQKCAGLNSEGHIHDIGTNIGIISSQALSEPATQIAMDSTRHSSILKIKSDNKLLSVTMEDFFNMC